MQMQYELNVKQITIELTINHFSGEYHEIH